MKCTKCGCYQTVVLATRHPPGGLAIRRRRECLVCHHRMTTYESTLNPQDLLKAVDLLKKGAT